MRNKFILIPRAPWGMKLSKAQDLMQAGHLLKPHVPHGQQNAAGVLPACCRCLARLFRDSHTLGVRQSAGCRQKYANWSTCLYFAQTGEVFHQIKRSMNFQFCTRRAVVNFFSIGAVTKSCPSVWKKGEEGNIVWSSEIQKLNWGKMGGVLDLASPPGLSSDFFPWSLFSYVVCATYLCQWQWYSWGHDLQSRMLPVLYSV